MNMEPFSSQRQQIPDEQSSNHSSYKELALADEHGLRTSFRTVPRHESPLRLADIHVYDVPRDSRQATPDSVISSGSVALRTGDGHLRNFNVGRLQQEYNNKPSHSGNDTQTFAPIAEIGLGASASGLSEMNESKQSSKFYFGRQSMRKQLRQEQDARNRANDTSNNNFQLKNTQSDISQKDTKDTEMKKEKGITCFPKLMLFCIVLLVLVAGIVLLIYFKKEPEASAYGGKINPKTTEKPKIIYKEICPTVEVLLRDPIWFECNLVAAEVLPHQVSQIKVTPPLYWNKGTPFIVDVIDTFGKPSGSVKIDNTNSWQAEIDYDYRMLVIQGVKATCNAEGRFGLEFFDRGNISQFNTSIYIDVKSQVQRVNVTLSQTINNDAILGCSTNSGCERSTLEFLAHLENSTSDLMGFNYSCTINYDDYNGYDVACFGTVPESLLQLISKYQKISCRPKSNILIDYKEEELLSAEIELPECDLSVHCGYKCKDDSDYYVVSGGRCDIFHRCYGNQIATSYCAPGTFFDPGDCACRHTRDLPWCQDNGALKPNSDVKDKTCAVNDMNT